MLPSFSWAGRPTVKHLGQDIIRWASTLLSLVTVVPATAPAPANNTSISSEATGVTCLPLIKIKGSKMIWINSFYSTIVKTEEESGRHRNSKILINADCLSNRSIRAQGASSKVYAAAVRRDFPFADNQNSFLLFCSWENNYPKLFSLRAPAKVNFKVVEFNCPQFSVLTFFVFFFYTYIYNFITHEKANFTSDCFHMANK